jgi:hypothetical protein
MLRTETTRALISASATPRFWVLIGALVALVFLAKAFGRLFATFAYQG